MPDTTIPLCKVCKTEEATTATEPPGEDGVCHYDICRDCELDRLYEKFSCPECRRWIIRRDIIPNSHEPTCSKRSPPCETCGGDSEHKKGCAAAFRGLLGKDE